MRTCGVIGAVVLSIIAVPALLFAILYTGFAQTVLNSPTFLAKLDPANLEAQFQKMMPYIVADALTNPDNPDNQDLITQLFPDAGMRGVATDMLPDVLASTGGDLSPEKMTEALGPNLDQALTTMVDTAPECSAEAEAELRIAITSERDLPGQICRPSDPATQQQLVAYIGDTVRTAFVPVLDPSKATDMNQQFNTMGDTAPSKQDMLDGVEAFKAGATQSWILPAMLFVLIIALAVRTVRSLLAWLGANLLATGLFGLGIAFTSQTILNVDWQSLIQQQSTSSEAQILGPMLEMFYDPVFNVFVAWITYAYIGSAVAGMVGIIIALLIKPPLPPAPSVLHPMPGTPDAVPVMTTGTTTPVATDLSTGTLPVGDVTKPLPANDGDINKTDEHRF